MSRSIAGRSPPLSPSGESISESDYAARYLGLDDRDCFRQAFEEAGMTSPVGNQLTSLIARKNHDYETEIQNSSYLRREIDLVLSVNSLAGSFEFIIAADAVWPDFTGRTAADLPWSHG
ncbi:MAG: hypothetical protein ABI836_02740 [Gemmatimonadota bacterium]